MVISWLPRWVEFALVLLAAWLVAGLFAGGNLQQAHAPTLEPGPGETQVSAGEILLQNVHLFGKASEKPKVKAKPIAVKASKLNVKLIGTVVAGDKSAAMVMMNGSKEQQVFFIGEEMKPQVKLFGVEAAEIIIDNRGKKERISIEAGKSIASAPRARARPSNSRARVKKVDRRINKNMLQKQMRNFSTLLSQARVTPHFTNKKADGFTISEIVKGSLYEEIGLQNGDVIQKVNGESVTSAEQAMRMYRELQNATFIDVEINRGGSTQQVSYTIQ